MKMNIRHANEQHSPIIAELEYTYGEGVSFGTMKPTLTAADLKLLATALELCAAGLEGNDDPTLVRNQVEAGVIKPRPRTLPQGAKTYGSLWWNILSDAIDAIEKREQSVPEQPPTLYRYQCTHRPPTEDAIPKGAIKVEFNYPLKDGEPFGFVTYAVPLTARDAYRYDLERIAPPLSMPVYPVGTWMKNMNTGKTYPVELIAGEYWIGDEIMETPRDFRIYEMLDPQPEAVPEDVIEALLVVRSTALCNMLDRACVLHVMEDQNYHSAVEWLDENRDRFMEALNLMGKRVGK